MNKYLLFLSITGALFAGAQTVPDSSLVDRNFERMSELKSKLKQVNDAIDDQDDAEINNNEIMQFLQQLSEKINLLAFRQDSLILELRKVAPEKNIESNNTSSVDDLYYLVIESQLTSDRANAALKKYSLSVQEEISIKGSNSGTWYYIVLSNGISENDVRTELAQLRKKFPNAWYVKNDQIKN